MALEVHSYADISYVGATGGLEPDPRSTGERLYKDTDHLS